METIEATLPQDGASDDAVRALPQDGSPDNTERTLPHDAPSDDAVPALPQDGALDIAVPALAQHAAPDIAVPALPQDAAPDIAVPALPQDAAPDIAVPALPQDAAPDIAAAALPQDGLAQDGAPDDTVRAALRRAITERKVADARHQHLATAEELVREVCSAAESALLAFSDVEATIVQYRAEDFKRAAISGSLPAISLPDDLSARRAMRDAALTQVMAAKATHENLVTDLNQAESAKRQAGLSVAVAAIDVLVGEGTKQASALSAAWNEIWRQFDRISALADCRLDCGEASFPIMLPSEIVGFLRVMAALDNRQGRNPAAENAGEAWCRWFKLLLADAEAEVEFDRIGA
jgi:hypothetical protein